MVLRVRLATVLVAFFVFSLVSNAQAQVPNQIRGFWVDASRSGIKSRAEIDTLIERLHRAHCNAVFAQVRVIGGAYYRSHYEPRAADNRATAFDPLGYLVERAHAATPRISVHAWINTFAVGEPLDAAHILAKHPAWRAISEKGGKDDNEVVKVDPGVPGAEEWTYRVCLDIVSHYDVDGIHLDFARYAGTIWGYAPESVARFNARYERSGTPSPADRVWQQWRRDQVSSLVRKVYANAVAVRPSIVVSAACVASGDAPASLNDWPQSAAYSQVFQNWQGWLSEGIIDVACPMTYFDAAAHRDFQEHWATFIKENPQNRAATLAVGAWLNTLPETLDLARIDLAATRSGKTAAGVLFYGCQTPMRGGTPPESLWDALPGVFPDVVPFPTLPWKEHPVSGHVKGTVLVGPGLVPADGASVTIKRAGGTPVTHVTDGTGFFAFLDLAPGDYEATVNFDGETSYPKRFTITPGEVETRDFLLAGGDMPTPRPVGGTGLEAHGARVVFARRAVTVGTDGMGGGRFMLSDAPGVAGAPVVEVRVRNPLALPLVAGDLVTLTGTVAHPAHGKAVVVADAVQVVGRR